ncbi:MAG: outer membrane protein assembly factor BamA [Sphingomonadaceae bacterium]
MKATKAQNFGRKAVAALLLSSALTVAAMPVAAQTASTPAGGGIIKTISVTGSQRLEPDTVRSYVKLRPGAPYTLESLDAAVRDLFETELFADAQIRDNQGNLTIEIRENPVINRIVLEGNKRLKEDKIRPEIKLAPRQIFTRSKVRADVARIIELYRRQGRFAASVDPKMVQLDQNRVDVIFEVTEGPKSKVRQINIIGNKVFSDGEIRSEMATKQSRFYRFLSSGDSYDPDKLAYDQAKLRQFYLTKGYADFRVVSAVAELTPDKRDFIVTYVIEEGERYKFGEVTVDSDIRDFKPNAKLIGMKKGDWYNAKLVEDTVDGLTESAGLFGYAFAEVNPQFDRDQEARTMTLTLRVADAPRVYIERVEVNGNTTTQDKVVRREFRLAEGDAFNTFQVKRSSDRIQSLGFFQEKLEIEQKPGSSPDRIILEANVEEKSSGELQLSAGFSSLERFILNASIRQRNFRGKGQELRASVNYSSFSRSVELGFTEPYLFDRNIALGGDIFRRDSNQFNFTSNGSRNTTYRQSTTGFQFRVGVPLTEFWSIAGRFGVNFEDVTLDTGPNFFTNGQCDPLKAGRFLCDAIGKRTTSTLGYSLVFNNLNNRLRPSRGQSIVFNQDFAGLGGNVRYIRSRLEAAKYWKPFGQFIFSVSGEAGLIVPFGKRRVTSPSDDPVRLTDRFFLGEPDLRGFDIRGVGPRVTRLFYDTSTASLDDFLPRTNNQNTDDAVGGRALYRLRAELEIPLGTGAKELGLRPSIFLDVGSVFKVRNLTFENGGLQDVSTLTCTVPGVPTTDNPTPGPTIVSSTLINTRAPGGGGSCAAGETPNQVQNFREFFFGNSAKPRVSVGIGVNWNSPFGPFRIDLARALLKQEGDDTKLFTFNVGTQF